jgi:glutamate synthase domain-containing protein 3
MTNNKLQMENTKLQIDAKGLHYRELNERIYQAVNNGVKEIILDNVNGQRYIGTGLKGKDIKITINGIPGNDLAAFMDGPRIIVNSNAQDGVGNTMNTGEIIIHGDAGDIVGHSMRGGKIFIKGNVGYRVGIHMKAYKEFYPVIVVGGKAYDFLGEYMSGGMIIVLGLNKDKTLSIVGNYTGTGMHGGTIYIRGNVQEYQLGKEVGLNTPNEEEKKLLQKYIIEYFHFFNFPSKKILAEEIINSEFVKLYPKYLRPYGRLYNY